MVRNKWPLLLRDSFPAALARCTFHCSQSHLQVVVSRSRFETGALMVRWHGLSSMRVKKLFFALVVHSFRVHTIAELMNGDALRGLHRLLHLVISSSPHFLDHKSDARVR